MCGIVGFSNLHVSDEKAKETIKIMLDQVRHRGPDEEGYAKMKNTFFGHARLKVIDLETGKQPIVNEDNSVMVMCNGEIYNFKELRNDLERKGHIFRSKSDTEVIVHLYEQKGIACISELRGMFAIALYDKSIDTVYLIRDRFGQKPLYYFHDNNVLYFASEIKCFLKLKDIPKTISNDALCAYLQLAYVPAPYTMYEKIKKVMPATIIRYTNGNIAEDTYWKISYLPRITDSYLDAKERIKELMLDAVRLRLQSDVPVGVFLSGGIDSSILASIIKETIGININAYSIGFDDKLYDESKYAEDVARHINIPYETLHMTPRIINDINDIVWKNDQPFADSSSIAMYYLSREAKKHITVAITGDGGDECFWGYDRYRGIALYEKIRFIYGIKSAGKILFSLLNVFNETAHSKRRRIKLKKYLSLLKSNEKTFLTEYFGWFSQFRENDLNNLLCDNLHDSVLKKQIQTYTSIFNQNQNLSLTNRIHYLDLCTYLPNDLLVKSDQASMAHGLEIRSPFLDHQLHEYVARLPIDYKLRMFNSKRILKDTYRNKLPMHIINRKKRGFGVPVSEWLSNDLINFCADILFSRKCEERGYLNSGFIKKMVNDHICGIVNNGYRLWNLLMLELWFINVDEKKV